MKIKIDSCLDCPLSSTDREENGTHLLICGHPNWNDVMNKNVYIMDLFPEEPPEDCPLLVNKLTIELDTE